MSGLCRVADFDSAEETETNFVLQKQLPRPRARHLFHADVDSYCACPDNLVQKTSVKLGLLVCQRKTHKQHYKRVELYVFEW